MDWVETGTPSVRRMTASLPRRSRALISFSEPRPASTASSNLVPSRRGYSVEKSLNWTGSTYWGSSFSPRVVRAISGALSRQRVETTNVPLVTFRVGWTNRRSSICPPGVIVVPPRNAVPCSPARYHWRAAAAPVLRLVWWSGVSIFTSTALRASSTTSVFSVIFISGSPRRLSLSGLPVSVLSPVAGIVKTWPSTE